MRGLHAYQENIDTSLPQGKRVFAIMASLAELESALIAERPTPESVKRDIRSLKAGGPARAIAREVGVSVGTVANCLKDRQS
jgi:DNA invertase Pin-like site-specific DNA recombinase